MSSLETFSLRDKVALVIGGSSGIGREIAIGFQNAGARLAILGKTASKVDEVVTTLRADGGDPAGYQADVTDMGALKQTLSRVIADLGRIDVLVNSQGTTVLKPAEEFTMYDFDRIMDTNFRSVFFASVTIGRHMLERGEGSIISITSIAAHIGFTLSALYDASKHGVLGLTRTMAVEWATRGVRVNAIAPGVFVTPLNRDLMSAERQQGLLQRTPMRRFGDLGELVGAALYLASPASAYTTGSTITVDGGYRAAAL